jgi:ParB family chromosome partitioning protein
MSAKRTGLGKGLSALLASNDTDVTELSGDFRLGTVAMIRISDIEANPFQPRLEFDPSLLNELADSIKVHGVIQPITVRKMGYGKYQIISGERRTKASILCGLTDIPAYIRLANDQEMLEMALIENIQRKDLNAIEIAISYKRLLEECSLKQEELGERVGKDRTTVNNYLRLLRLPEEIQAALRDERISMGHARAIINVENGDEQKRIFNEIISGQLSVRKVEDLVRETQGKQKAKTPQLGSNENDGTNFIDEFETYQYTLGQRYSSKVAFRLKSNGKGEVVLSFNGKNDLQRLIELLES